ncbi:TetR/AcrR family transcriptional regulator C-terminal domain-containing protein [Nonomuraea endophytica]|uniref:TetR/AcrR family tetracycline transcriptional repressor n=1 Tax=Nonomuraea endophytica TaxID=714136 RepID=A0A7W8ADU1_9ACTN|nr:TetR/AcrR family transcriptional regulator C-terminal domain-containing protein [Nonomuraea endophytica]MBB5083226.1 TetR/AcrR family tetracycline transcriptional repressor [Nonomuraea endophytica]
MQLKRADVVTGALALLDTDGLDGLTMRKLGARLGVQAGGIYWHFTNKEALLGAMADRIVGQVTETPLTPAPWDAQLAEIAHRLRRAMLAHRDGARVVAGTYVTEPNTVRGGDQAMRILTDAGFPLDRAAWVIFTAMYYVLGHTIEEQAQREAGDWERRGSELAGPELRRAVEALITADPEERFAYGLELFLDGVRLRLAEAQE